MGGKKQIIIIMLLTLLTASGIVTFSYNRMNVQANQFDAPGYILTSAEEDKQVRFEGGTSWRNGLSDMVTFTDVQGNEKSVSANSFAHYQNKGISALSAGVVVDINDIATTQVTNHYAISPTVKFENNNGTYTPSNASNQLAFSEFVWKLSADKYMLVASDMSIHFSDDDIREATDFVEVTYIDEGVIQLQTEDNLWQTISNDCYAMLASGEQVNFSMRNIANDEGEVLMDFAKIVLDANDNVEVIPVTAEIAMVQENTIPYIDITGEQGKDGTSGDIGATGQAGENGTIGTAGETGLNGTDGKTGEAGAAGAAGAAGSAGRSGTNGAAGNPGASGNNGDPGNSAQVNGTVLHFPTFTLSTWNVTPTSCSGVITVTDPGQMLEYANGSIQLLDATTNTVFAQVPNGQPFYNTGNFDFSFDGLTPDHSYRLVVSAQINTHADAFSTTYTRDFISKTFWTDSAGVYLEARNSTTDSATIYIGKQSYASNSINTPVVYLFDNYAAANGATLSSLNIPTTYRAVQRGTLNNSVTFTGLSSNTGYYARLMVSSGSTDILTNQVLSVMTLKATPTISAPSLTANRDSWGFDLVPGAVNDPDNSITGYEYVFYTLGGEEVRRVSASNRSSLVVPLGGGLEAGIDYRVQTIAYYNNNAISSTVVSALSNPASVTGGRLPMVYFTNTGSSVQGTGSSAAASTSTYYDALEGVVHVAPGTEGARLVLNANDYVPTLTVRASGYYYVQYPVYLDTDSIPAEVSATGRYLTAEQDPDGTVRIAIGAGMVDGLKPGMQYSLIVSGNLQNGTNAPVDAAQVVGMTIVSTPNTVPITATYNLSDTATASSVFDVRMTMSAPAAAATDSQVEQQFARQMSNLEQVRLELYSGAASNPGTQLGELTLTPTNYTSELTEAAFESTLGEQMQRGITLTCATWNASNVTIPLTPVTAVNKSNGQGNWLGKVTVQIGTDGKIPTVKFIPMTASAYYTAKGLRDSELTAAVNSANNGTAYDTDGKTVLFFYDGAHDSEPMTGHRFVFAWTLIYETTDSTGGSVVTEQNYYPFDQDPEYTVYGIPRSEAQDCPHRVPQVYTIPWKKYIDSTDGSIKYTWKMKIYDPDQAITDSQNLYWRDTELTVRDVTAAALPNGTIRHAKFRCVSDGHCLRR